MSDLIQELEKERKNIKTDHYSMSIGEIVNLYKEGDIKLDPAFQRLFRWSDEQKTRFIESVLLGIPIPEIFVAQLADGKWVVVDGVQRISTILQLMGELTGREPLMMTAAKYLPSLKDNTWETLPVEAQRVFKRGKFGINIILTENSVQAQYELFQRLNTGGLHLEDQEIRNCLIIMVDPNFHEKLDKLKTHPSFEQTVQLNPRRIHEEYHMELILRYFIAKHGNIDYSQYSLNTTHIRDFFDQETIRLMNDPGFDLDREIELFKETFDWLNSRIGDKAFQKYNPTKDRFEGGFSNAAYEVVLTGIGLFFDRVKTYTREELVKKIEGIYRDPFVIGNTRAGIKALVRFKELTEFSKKYFSI